MRRLFLVILLVALTACAHLSIIHLDKNLWSLGKQETLEMRHWNFEYTSKMENNRLIISGRAIPNSTSIPTWASWVQDLWVQVYLSDDDSRVLAKDLRLYLPMDLDRNQGVPFEFFLTPDGLGSSGPLFISFGYRMELTAGRSPQPILGQETQVFFASQGALNR